MTEAENPLRPGRVKKKPPPGRPKKIVCPMNRAHFSAEAHPLVIRLGGEHPCVNRDKVALPKHFDGGKGSMGWYMNDRDELLIDGLPIAVNVQIIVTVIGSKELPPLKPQ